MLPPKASTRCHRSIDRQPFDWSQASRSRCHLGPRLLNTDGRSEPTISSRALQPGGCFAKESSRRVRTDKPLAMADAFDFFPPFFGKEDIEMDNLADLLQLDSGIAPLPEPGARRLRRCPRRDRCDRFVAHPHHRPAPARRAGGRGRGSGPRALQRRFARGGAPASQVRPPAPAGAGGR